MNRIIVWLIICVSIFPSTLFIASNYAENISASSADGFVFPVIKDEPTNPSEFFFNEDDPLSNGWKGNGVGANADSKLKGHLGQDYFLTNGNSTGKRVYATANGTVVEVMDSDKKYGWCDEKSHGWGRVIVIKHEAPEGAFFNTDGSIASETYDSKDSRQPGSTEKNPTVVYTLYGHLSKQDLDVKPGDIVKKGQPIARIGSSAEVSEFPIAWTPHLHFEIKSQKGYEEGVWDKENPGKHLQQWCEEPISGIGSGYSYIANYTPERYDPKVFVINNLQLDKSTAEEETPPRKEQKRVTTFSAKPGFYIQFHRCHACAYYGWQEDTISALENAGVQAFVSDDTRSHYTEQPYWSLKALQLRGVSTEDWPVPVYAGPFDSEYAARQVFLQIPSTLDSWLDNYDKRRAEIGDTTNWSRQLENCIGNQCDLVGFFIQLVQVTETLEEGVQIAGQPNPNVVWKFAPPELNTKCATKSSDITIEGHVSPSTDVSNHRVAIGLIDEAQAYVLEKCEWEFEGFLGGERSIGIGLYSPNYKDGKELAAIGQYKIGLMRKWWLSIYENFVREDSFKQKYSVDSWLDSYKVRSQFTANPFPWKGKVVGFVAQFKKVLSENSGVFLIGFGDSDDVERIVVIEDIPTLQLANPGQMLLLAVKVDNMQTIELQEYPMMKLNVPQLSLVGIESNGLIYQNE